MTDNNAMQPAEKVGPIRRWIKDHPNIWEFILFNVLSNISTITRFVVTWIGTAIFISGMGLTQPFHFLIFNYDTKGNGLGGFLTFLLAEVLAQVPGMGYECRRRGHHRLRGQHLACRGRELSVAQVLGHAEKRVQGDSQERGDRQVALF